MDRANLGAASDAPAGMAIAATVVDESWHHEVSILIVSSGVVGRCIGWQPRVKVSMMTMRPPQQGQQRDDTSAVAVSDERRRNAANRLQL